MGNPTRNALGAPLPPPPRASGLHWAAELAIRLLLTGVIAYGFYWVLSGLAYDWNWDTFLKARPLYWQGLVMTLKISGGAMVIALAIGTLAALGRLSHNIVARHLADLYVEVVRGTPLLVQIFVMWYGIFFVVGDYARTHGMPEMAELANNRVFAGTVILGLFAGAYIAETIRAGIQSIDPGQREAGMALGLNGSQVMRLIVFPQAFRRILPPLTGEMIALIKDSSLLQIIAIAELTRQAYDLSSRSYKHFEAFLPLAAIYLALTYPLSLVTRYLEARHGRH